MAIKKSHDRKSKTACRIGVRKTPKSRVKSWDLEVHFSSDLIELTVFFLKIVGQVASI